MDNSAVFPGFETVRLIREEKTGSLYEIKKQDDDSETAALKIIRLDNDSDKDHLASLASVCLDNKELNGDNVVRYDDIRYVRHPNETGFDIQVKTERLVPFTDAADFTEDDVIKMAKDICIALEACENRGLVHGRIGPSNIFFTESGTYKLGDVGIERTYAQYRTVTGSDFSAPEIDGYCDNRSDIYSLGFIMYWLLNDCKMPSKKYDLSSGPSHGSEGIKAIISKACTVNANYRYQSAREMLDDLEALTGGMAIIRRLKSKTVKGALKALRVIAAVALSIFVLVWLFRGYDAWRLSASAHEHDYYFTNSNSSKHWDECECGEHTKDTDHDYSLTKDLEYHWEECFCGRINGYKMHSFESWVVVVEATEEAAGLQESFCEVCKYYTTEVIPMLPHTHKYPEGWSRDDTDHWKECPCGEIIKEEHSIEVWETIVFPTETTEGMSEGRCDICDYYATQTVPKLSHKHAFGSVWKKDASNHWYECACGTKNSVGSHSYGAWTVTKAATIYAAGSQERACNECGYTQSEVIPKIPHTHSFGTGWEKDASNHWHKCSCGEKNGLASHSYGAWTVTKAATIYATGLQERSCTECGYTQTEVIPKIEHTHSYTPVWITDSTNHWQNCTCGEKGYFGAHSYGAWTVIKAATSTSTGLRQRVCTVCKYAQTETIPINSHSHNFTGNWKTNVSYHWKQCSCGEQSQKAQHSLSVWVVTKEATATSEGTKQRVCTVCGYTQIEAIPILLEIESVSIVSKPTKTEYVVGESLNTSGLSLQVKYSNGMTSTVTSGFECTPVSFKTEGQKLITVTYRDKKATFTVNVAIGYVQKITVNTMPSKTVYEIGDSLNTSGLRITVHYTNGQTETISSGFTCTPTSFSSAGTKTVTVTYNGKSTAFAVNVNEAVIESVSVKTKPNKTSYSVGSTLNTAGLVLEVRYSDGTIKYVTSGFTCTPTKLTSSGTKWITVSYEGFTTGFSVTVT